MNSEPSNVVKFYNGEQIPLELHKVRVVQKLHLVPVERRLEAAQEAGFNTFQLSTNDVYLDMLTDSGVNAMTRQPDPPPCSVRTTPMPVPRALTA